MNDTLHQEIASLRRENDELRAELDVIKSALAGTKHQIARTFRLPPKCAQLLAILMSGREYTKSHLHEPVWDGRETQHSHTVAMHTIRKRIPWLTLKASSKGSPFASYQLSKADINRLKAELAGH